MSNKTNNNATNGQQAEKQQVTTVKVTIYEHFRKGTLNEFQNVEFQPINFTKFVGNLIDPKNKEVAILEKKNAITFKIEDGTKNGLLVSIPSETANSDKLTRVIKTFKEVAAQMFVGFDLEEETTNKLHKEILLSLDSSGVKFSNFSKIAVNSGLNSWAQNKRLKVSIMTEKTKRLNLRTNCENEVMRDELTKVIAVRKAKEEEIKPQLATSLKSYLNTSHELTNG